MIVMTELKYRLTDLADALGVKESTAKKYYLLIEREGYNFTREKNNHISFQESEVNMLKKMMELKSQPGTTLQDAVEEVVSMMKSAHPDHNSHNLSKHNSYNPDEIKELKELIIQQSEMLKEQQQAIQRLESKFNDAELKQLESQETKEELPDTENKNSSESDEQVTEQPLENENTDRSTNEEVQEKKGFWKKLFGY
jgi:DNA-binding transcriptional MocR family regulator